MVKAIMDRVFIKLDEKKQGSIITLDEEKEETKSGIVESVGEDVKSVKAGDHVVFFKWDDLPVIDGLVAAREKDLLGIWDE